VVNLLVVESNLVCGNGCKVAIVVAVVPAGSLRSSMGTCSACWLKAAMAGDVGSRYWRKLKSSGIVMRQELSLEATTN